MRKVTIELEVINAESLSDEEIEQDIRWGEGQIGWQLDYNITSIKVT